jgi:hypothetical protein
MIECGVYTDLSSEDYHADNDSISRSSIMAFKKSPLYYYKTYLERNRPSREKDTSSVTIGKAFHHFVLETHTFYDHYMIKPDKVLLKEVGRAEYDEVEEERARCEKSDRIKLSENDFFRISEMYDALKYHYKAPELILNAIYESSYFWRDAESNVLCKARPDILRDRIYIDLKTCSDASEDAFQRSMAMYGNHIQAAMVVDGVFATTGKQIDICVNICIETSYPYSIGIYVIDELAIQTGREEYKRILLDLKHAIRHNEWDDFPLRTVGLPRWY